MFARHDRHAVRQPENFRERRPILASHAPVHKRDQRNLVKRRFHFANDKILAWQLRAADAVLLAEQRLARIDADAEIGILVVIKIAELAVAAELILRQPMKFAHRAIEFSAVIEAMFLQNGVAAKFRCGEKPNRLREIFESAHTGCGEISVAPRRPRASRPPAIRRPS